MFGMHWKSWAAILGTLVSVSAVYFSGTAIDEGNIHDRAQQRLEIYTQDTKASILTHISQSGAELNRLVDQYAQIRRGTDTWQTITPNTSQVQLHVIQAKTLRDARELSDVPQSDAMSPPFRFGDFRMVRQFLETGEYASEAFQFEDGWYIRDITQRGEDVWLATWPMSLYSQLLIGQLERGRVAILQTLPGSSPRLIFSQGMGESGYKTESPMTLTRYWSFTFELSQAELNALSSPGTSFYVAVGVSGLLVLIGLFLTIRIENAERASQRQRARGLRKNSSAHDSHWTDVPHHVFRDYDVRGKAYDFSDGFLTQFGKAFGSLVLKDGGKGIYLCRDARIHSPRFFEKFSEGVISTGCDVIDIGQGPSGLLYYATEEGQFNSGVMITASHNGKEYNGMKLVLGGAVLDGARIREIKAAVMNNQFNMGEGKFSQKDLRAEYAKRLLKGLSAKISLKVVLDCGNGIAGPVASKVLTAAGCEVVPLFCNPDGEFPNHDPDPSHIPNLDVLRQRVIDEEADLGIALDGDGDRVFAVDELGNVVMPDQMLMLLAKEISVSQPNAKLVYDIKSSNSVANYVERYGMTAVMCASGHSIIRNRLVKDGAMIAGELSGHIFLADDWYGFDDGIYAAIRLLRLLATRQQPLSEVVATLPQMHATPEIRIPVAFGYEEDVMRVANQQHNWPDDAEFMTLDGVRVELSDGWGLVRKSNTENAITFRFEGDSEEALQRIRQLFYDMLSQELVEVEWDDLLSDSR